MLYLVRSKAERLGDGHRRPLKFSGEKRYVVSHAAWFDTVNQYHGADATGGLSFSIRVDGRFKEVFRGQIPIPAGNPAAAPSLWVAACEAGGNP